MWLNVAKNNIHLIFFVLSSFMRFQILSIYSTRQSQLHNMSIIDLNFVFFIGGEVGTINIILSVVQLYPITITEHNIIFS